MSHHIFIASSTFAEIDDKPLEILKANGLAYSLNTTKKRLNQEQLIAQAEVADAVIAGLEVYDNKVLEHLKKLRCISRCGIGVDNIDLVTAEKNRIKVLTTPKVVIQPVVEMTLAMIFNLLRKVSEHNSSMHQRQWQRLVGSQLAGKTVGVIGLGRIGRKVAESLLNLGTKVIGYDICPDKDWAKTFGVTMMELDSLLGHSDIVTLHLAQDVQNPLKLSTKQFKTMKKGALIINMARGAFIDEKALGEALKEGDLSGAGLDVFEQEPYSGPLCDLPNIILTPHVATLTQESRPAMEIEAVENVINFFK